MAKPYAGGSTKEKKVARTRRRKICKFCADKIEYIDYKDVKRLKLCTTERGKIVPRRISGNCAIHQRQLTASIRRARNIALMPYAAEAF